MEGQGSVGRVEEGVQVAREHLSQLGRVVQTVEGGDLGLAEGDGPVANATACVALERVIEGHVLELHVDHHVQFRGRIDHLVALDIIGTGAIEGDIAVFLCAFVHGELCGRKRHGVGPFALFAGAAIGAHLGGVGGAGRQSSDRKWRRMGFNQIVLVVVEADLPYVSRLAGGPAHHGRVERHLADLRVGGVVAARDGPHGDVVNIPIPACAAILFDGDAGAVGDAGDVEVYRLLHKGVVVPFVVAVGLKRSESVAGQIAHGKGPLTVVGVVGRTEPEGHAQGVGICREFGQHDVVVGAVRAADL